MSARSGISAAAFFGGEEIGERGRDKLFEVFVDDGGVAA